MLIVVKMNLRAYLQTESADDWYDTQETVEKKEYNLLLVDIFMIQVLHLLNVSVFYEKIANINRIYVFTVTKMRRE
jgi:hypothetical protein